MTRTLIRFLIHLLFRFIAPVEVRWCGVQPPEGPFIGVSNHVGRLDPPLVYYFLDRDDITILVAEKYQRYALVRWIVRQLDSVFVDRFNADLGALRLAISRLRGGGVLVIAPEGTRSPPGALLEGQPGAAYLAARTGVPILPAGVTGTRDREVLARFRRFRRPRITARFGQPFTLPPLDPRDRESALRAHTDEIMCRLAALLPPDYRGIYGDHPRLQELLSQSGESHLEPDPSPASA